MSTLKLALPPLDGTLSILPHFADFQAQHNPAEPIYVFPSPDSSSTDTVAVSFLDFANATHRIAHSFRPGRTGPEGDVVGLLINTDTILFHALLVGLIRAGIVPFALSPRNSAAAVVSLMERTGCHRIISQSALAPLTDEISTSLPAGYEFQLDAIPTLTALFPTLFSAEQPSALPQPYPTQPHPHKPSDLVLYLHSSGSTGFPKPVKHTHTTLLQWCTMPVVAEARGAALRWGAMALPPFHGMGLTHQLLAPLASGHFSAVFAPRAPAPPVVPTAENILEVVRRTDANAVVSVPTFVEAWAHNDDDVKFLATRKAVIFGGGPLSTANGTKLVAGGVPLFILYGATEFGCLTRVLDADVDLPVAVPNPAGKTREDWEWAQFPDVCKPRWVAEGDGTYELQMMTWDRHQPSVENLSNGERGYATSDLFEPHPTKPGLWRIVGRKDDVIVLGSGEKTVPVPQESYISTHPLVSGAIMFGRGRLQPGILIEPKAAHTIPYGDERAIVEFRNEIWPKVEEANHSAPAFSRIFKEMIIVTDPARPLPRVAKGTVQRKQSLSLYADDIEALYEKVENSADAHGIAPPLSWAASDVKVWLTEHATTINSGKRPMATQDLFEQGFDSLSATFLRNRIIGALRSSSDPAANAAAVHVQPNFVFTNPTLVALANAVAALVDPTARAVSRTPVEEMRALIEKYTALLPVTPITITNTFRGGAVVVLTGTTGGLGAHLLALLLTDARIARVYALNRGANITERQRSAFEGAMLPANLMENQKLVLLSGNLTREDFGLEPAVLEEIRASVTHVVHNAWRVDFNLVLSSYEPQIDAAVRLASLAPGIHFLFTSSVSVAQGWRPEKGRGAVPEAVLRDPALAVGHGYGMSKFVVEEILANAQKVGMKTTVLRIGQISGATETGAWNTSDWVPSMIKSSISLGQLPTLRGMASWLPVDAVANAMLDLLLSADPPAVVNVVHPRPVPWQEFSAAISNELGCDLPQVSLDDWIEQLERVAQGASQDDIHATPAIKLLEYFHDVLVWEREAKDAQVSETEVGGLPVFQTSKVQAASPTLKELRLLGDEDARDWIRYWRQRKYIA